MGYLVHILLAVFATGLVDLGVKAPLEMPVLAGLLCAVPYLLAFGVRRAYVSGQFRRGNLFSALLAWAAPLLQLACVSLLGWTRSVSGFTGRDFSLLEWPSPAVLLALAPYVAYELCVIDARARLSEPRPAARRSVRAFQGRMFLSGLLPVVLYVLVASAVGASDVVRINVEEVAVWNGAFAAFLLTAFTLLLPTFLRNTWETVPLASGVQRDVLESVARVANFRCREICEWRTGHLMANAAIVGVGRRNRIVLFSDSLLAQLEPRELAAVFAHEMGHARYHHVLIFGMWALAFFMGADVLSSWLVPDDDLAQLAVFGAALVGWYFGFGYMSRRFELQADLFGLELLGDADGLIGALERVGGSFRDVASWRHFSTRDRVAFLERAALDDRTRRSLHTSLRWFTRLGFLGFVAAFVLELVVLGSTYREDRIVALLRLGDYAEAAERVDGLGGDVARVASVAGILAESSTGGAPSEAEHEEAVREALARGDIERAVDVSRLARLRRFKALEPVGDVLEKLADGDVEGARRGLDAVGPDWIEVLEPLLRRAPEPQ